MRAASNALDSLDEKGRERLEQAFYDLYEGYDYDDGNIRLPILTYNGYDTVCAMADALQWAIGETAPERGQEFQLYSRYHTGRATRKGRQRGRPLGTVTNRPFRVFVLKLHQNARSCDGKLTFDRKKEAGTLIQALELIRPCLPDGFIPNHLPYTTIERILSPLKK
jgi:hypothetical protein